jgi:hypothetical protein
MRRIFRLNVLDEIALLVEPFVEWNSSRPRSAGSRLGCRIPWSRREKGSACRWRSA